MTLPTYPPEPTATEKATLEAEHGPLIFLTHPDGACFGFMAIDRAQFEVREHRVRTGNLDADEMLLQERAVWPSREAWNKYAAAAAFEVAMFVGAYKDAQGGLAARKCEPFELPDGADPALCWLTNGSDTFGFRKPGRAEVKIWSAKVNGKIERQRGEPEASEVLLRSCAAGPEFGAWLDRNLFGVGGFGDAFVAAFGAGTVRVSGK